MDFEYSLEADATNEKSRRFDNPRLFYFHATIASVINTIGDRKLLPAVEHLTNPVGEERA